MKRISVPKQYGPLFDDNASEIVASSGRSSGKNTNVEIYAIREMMKSKYNNVWYCRAEYSDIGDKCFSSMISTIQLMGLENAFSWKVSPYRITCEVSGAKCYFDGINGRTDDDLTATKGFTPQFKTLAAAILDEADQVKHPNHITAWESTLSRFLLKESKVIFLYNPPMSRSHWAHKFFAEKIRNGATKIYATWEDIRDLLKPKAIEIIEKFRKDDPEYYRYWYLGEPVSFKGMVYPQFRREVHCINVFRFMIDRRGDRVSECIFGLDEGTVNDSTCVSVLAIFQSGIAVCLDCLEIDPLKIGQQAPTQVSRTLVKFLSDTLKRFPFLQNVPRRWIFECAEGGQMLRLQFVEDSGEETYLVTNKSIMGDVKRVRSMLAEKILLFHLAENVNTIQLVEDIENYVFDEKNGGIKKGQRDDTIDSLEYATKLYYDTPLYAV